MYSTAFWCMIVVYWFFWLYCVTTVTPFIERSDSGYAIKPKKTSKQHRGTQRQFSGKYLFGRRFEIYNFRNICCKISCLPASPRIFEHLKYGIIAYF